MRTDSKKLRQQFGPLDIYLFDQLLKGRFDNCNRILDVGCGPGRNLHYFLKCGFDVYGLDRSAEAIEATQKMAAQLTTSQDKEHFQVAEADAIPFKGISFDAVICNAVLHFANDEEHFDRMLAAMWQALRPGGLFFCRLASSIGMETHLQRLEPHRYLLPGGAEWFLVDEAMLLARTEELGGTLLDPIKTTNVQNRRCMTTWCIQKNENG